MQYFFGIMTFLTSLFLILLILIQRGRGGGLAGALGGMGGQSAFGTKAGDLFTRVTIIVAAFWILLSVAAIKILNSSQDSVFGDATATTVYPEPGTTGSDLVAPPTGSATPDGAALPGTGGTTGLEAAPPAGLSATPEAPAVSTPPPMPVSPPVPTTPAAPPADLPPSDSDSK